LCLENWGYNYSNILIPTQTKKALVGINQEYVVIMGTKGQLQDVQSIIKSNKSSDLISFAENIGIKPFLFVGEVVTAKNWVYCIS
jgi:hypothetical protein